MTMTADPSTALSAGRESQYHRAREVLEGAGWLFEAFVAAEQRAWLQSSPMDQDRREHHYRRAHIGMELKALLESMIETYEFDLKQKGGRNGR